MSLSVNVFMLFPALKSADGPLIVSSTLNGTYACTYDLKQAPMDIMPSNK